MADDLDDLWNYSDSPARQQAQASNGTLQRSPSSPPPLKRCKVEGEARLLEDSDEDDVSTPGMQSQDSDVLVLDNDDSTLRQHAPGSAARQQEEGRPNQWAQQQAASRPVEELLDETTRAQWERNKAALLKLQAAATLVSDDEDDDSPGRGPGGGGDDDDNDVQWVPPSGPGRGAAAAGAANGGGGGGGYGSDTGDDGGGTSSAKLTLTVRYKDGGDQRFRIGPQEPLSTLFDAFKKWAMGQGLCSKGASLGFYSPDGDKLGKGDTCDSAGCEDDDVIEVQGMDLL